MIEVDPIRGSQPESLPLKTRHRFPTKPARDQLKPGECLCDFCTGKCCQYFSLPIDAPTTWDDYDSIRWYLAHGQTLVYTVKEQWYLLVKTRCGYLARDNRCKIYFNRPKICREYTTAECEYEEEWSFTKAFETPEQIWEYAEAILPPRRREASPAPALVVLNSPGPEHDGHRQAVDG